MDALAAREPDAVCISTYAETHADYAVAALEAGAHVFVEKPLAGDLADAERVIETARRTKRALVVGYILYVHPSWQRFIEIARTLGTPLVMRMNLNQQSSGARWATHKSLLRSTSPIVDCGVHYVDVMCRMTGSRPVSVSGIGARLTDEIAPGPDQLRSSAGDVRRWVGRVVRGRLGPDDERDRVLREGRDRPQGQRQHVAQPAPRPRAGRPTSVRTRSTEALRVHHADLAPDGSFARADEIVSVDDEPDHDELCRREQELFLRAIREGSISPITGRARLESLRIVLAADQSFREGRTIALG